MTHAVKDPFIKGAKRGAFASICLIAAFILITSCSGCAATPRAQYAQAQDSYIAVVQQLVNFRQAGEIDDDDWEDIAEAVKEGDRILDAIKSYVVRSENPPTNLLEALQAVVDALSAYAATAAEDSQ